MSRRDSRTRRPSLKLYVERLETRRMMSVGDRPLHPGHPAATAQPLESLMLESRTDASSFAWTLAHRPKLAAELGLGALSKALQEHAGFAARHGWGARLVSELSTHPRYAATHHLTDLLPAPAPSTTSTTATLVTSTTTRSVSTSAPVAPSPVSTTPSAPPVVVEDPLATTIGGTLDVTLPSLGLSGSGLSYTITPQPLPANMTFNRGTGALVFAPAPGQAGTYDFSVAVSSGSQSGTIMLPITVTAPAVATTEVSGQVVDENGNPLAGMPVTIGGASAVTNQAGDFTLTDIPSDPGPISAGGSVATAQGRLALMAPVEQLLGHDPYANANNVIAAPLIVPKIDWSSPASFSQSSTSQPLDITNAAMPGFGIDVPASAVENDGPAAGTVEVAELPAALAAQHETPGISGPLLLYQVVGPALSGPVQLTLPNSGGFAPGATLSLYTFNPLTGGHDVVGQVVVSADGTTMTSTGPVALNASSTSASSAAGVTTDAFGWNGSVSDTVGCIGVGPNGPNGQQNTSCNGCQPTITSMLGSAAANSDAGLVTGEYYLDHQLVTYQSQDQDIGIDLQYSSAQADPNPVVQYQFTTPLGGDSSDITSINAQVTLAGVAQGTATTYNTPDGLADGETYNIPLQVDASELATGVYSYTMTVTENFGSGSNEVSITSTNVGNVNVVNAASDPLGAGWSVGGLQQLSQLTTDGPVLITAGQQGTEAFVPVYTEGQSYVQDLAVIDGTQSAQVLANNDAGDLPAPSLPGIGTQFFGSEDVTPVATVAGVFGSNGLTDLAVVGTTSLSILLNNGSGGFTDGSYYNLPSGYDAKGIVAGNFSGHTNGVLDLAVLMASTSSNAYYVAEFTGSGSGTFATAVVSAVGNGVYSNGNANSMIAFGDTDGGDSDLAFTTDNGLADVMAPTSGGSFGDATSLSLPSGHKAVGVTAVDYNGNGDTDLVVEAGNTNLEDAAGPFAILDLYTGNGSGTFSYASSYQTTGHVDTGVTGLVSGDFQGSSMGQEIAVPLAGDGSATYLNVVPLTSSATWGNDGLYALSQTGGSGGNIVAADLDGAGKPSIAVSVGDSLVLFLADPASNQFLPAQTLTTTASTGGMDGTPIYELAVAPFMANTATPSYRGPTSDPSTLVHNSNGTWTRTYPDGTVIQFNAARQETSESDVNGNTFTYAYVTSGAAKGALASITDPVGLVTDLAYNSSGYLGTITDPADRVTTFTVNSSGDLTEIVNPDGAETQYGYNSSKEATSETDPDDNTAVAHYNSFGQLTSETLYGGTATTSIDSAQSNGLLGPGGSGSLATAYAASVTDPDGRTTTLTFNWMSHPTGETSALGGTSSTTYSNLGFPATETDAMGRVTTYTYNPQGDVTSITQPYVPPPGQIGLMGQTGGTETITYNVPYGVPTEITDFDGNTTTFVLDSHGNVLEEEQPGGVDQEWTYNSAGQMLTYKDADTNITTYTYNSLGRLTTITEPLPGSPTIRYTYDAAGDVTSVTDATDDTTTYTYNQMGQVLTEQNPVQAAADKETSFTYDADGNLLTTTDANGNTTHYSYNARNELIGATDPLGNVTHYGYDASGNLTSMTDPLGNVTYYTYDDDNNLLTVTNPTGGITSYTYDLDNEETSVTDPNGFMTTYSYNSQGEVQGVSEPEQVGSYTEEVPVATYTYNNDGDMLTSSDGDDHVTTYVYNALNEETSTTNPDGDTTQYTYNGDGDVLTVTDGLDHTTSYSYNAMGEELTETQPSGGGTTSYTYDAAGDLLTVEDPDDNVTSYTYNAAHEVATETSPTDGITTYTYDLVGNLTQSVDPDGHTIDYTYNADNEETSETWVNPDGGTPLDVFDYTYNADGEETAVSDNNSSYQYTYNADGEETSQDDVGSPDLPTVTLTYSYDPAGNETSMSDSLGGVVSYTYNARNEMTNETLSGTGISAEAVANLYDNAGNMTSQTRYSNLAETTVVAATSYTYDAAEQMTGITDKNSSGTTLVSYGYTYDAAGLVSQETRTWDSGADTNTLDYTYTDNDQLTSVTNTNSSFANQSFTYDANGNETGTGYTTSTGNEQTASPGYTYTYDADGNMITSTQTSTGDVWTYTYNYANLMTGAVEKSSTGAILAQVTYTYDALDNRIGMDENGTQTWTLYNGSTPIMDFSSTGSLETRYLNGPAGDIVDEVLARQSASGTVAWYLPDRLGTIRDLINNSGAIIDHVDYNAFGTVLDESAPSVGDRMMGFASLERDIVAGLNLAVHRVENPGTGRWTVLDTKGFAAGDANLYRYVGNGPTNAADPSGNFAPVFIGAGVGAATGFVVGASMQWFNWYVCGGTFSWTKVGVATAVGGITGAYVGAGFWVYSASQLSGATLTQVITAGSTTFLTVGGSSVATVCPAAAAAYMTR